MTTATIRAGWGAYQTRHRDKGAIMNESAIAWRHWSERTPMLYVAALPGRGGVDWGYTAEGFKALPLSRYWQRRFAADCARVGSVAQFRNV
jgi:hypothetical protein